MYVFHLQNYKIKNTYKLFIPQKYKPSFRNTHNKKIRNIMTVLTIPPYIPDNKMKRYFLVSLIVPDVIYIFYLRL